MTSLGPFETATIVITVYCNGLDDIRILHIEVLNAVYFKALVAVQHSRAAVKHCYYYFFAASEAKKKKKKI